MITKIMSATEKKIITGMEKGIKAGRDISLAIGNLFEKWEENDEYKLPADWLAERFDFSKQYVYKMASVSERFLTCENAEKYAGLSVTVLSEALPIDDDQIIDFIEDCESNGTKITAKVMREYVKSLKMLEAKEAAEEEEENASTTPSNEEAEENAFDLNEVAHIIDDITKITCNRATEDVREAIRRIVARWNI